MQIQKAENGWPGIFIPGDESLGLAKLFRDAAAALENDTVEKPAIISFLNTFAERLETCRVDGRA
jgi:hypothetical protein